MLKKRSGFTLVELLIVIIIIGILAGSMLLLLGTSSDKAEATKIISDLRSMKAAALMYYADGKRTVTGVTDLEPYMDRKIDSAKYNFLDGTESGQWFVSRIALADDGISKALADAAEEAGLRKYNTSDDAKYEKGDAIAYMRAR